MSSNIEKIVFGTLLSFPEMVSKYGRLIKYNAVNDDMNRLLLVLMLKIEDDSQTPTLRVLSSFMLRENKPLFEFFVKAQNFSRYISVADEYNILVNIQRLNEQYIHGLIYDFAVDIAHDPDNNKDVQALISRMSGIINSAEDQESLLHRPKTVDEVMVASIKRAEEAAQKGEEITGIPSRIDGINRITAGWQPGSLVVVGARPSMGKTAWALEIGMGAAMSGFPVLIFSLEMNDIEIGDRIISNISEINSFDIKRGKIDFERVNKSLNKISGADLYIDDTSGTNVRLMRGKVRSFAKRFPQGFLVIIDYLQLMISEKGSQNREQEISKISRSLKLMAKEYKIPVIALSQLSRDVEKRGGSKKPQLSDLRESGALEQDADMVIFLHRPEYYGQDQDENGNSTAGLCEAIFAKHRSGSLDTIKMNYIKQFNQFLPWIDSEGNPQPVHSDYGLKNYHEPQKEQGDVF